MRDSNYLVVEQCRLANSMNLLANARIYHVAANASLFRNRDQCASLFLSVAIEPDFTICCQAIQNFSGFGHIYL
jgi:hypothetical protein